MDFFRLSIAVVSGIRAPDCAAPRGHETSLYCLGHRTSDFSLDLPKNHALQPSIVGETGNRNRGLFSLTFIISATPI